MVEPSEVGRARTVARRRRTVPRLEPALEVAAYRLTSEALNNAVRHSHANHVTVDINLNGTLCIAVTDDGIGMQPDSVADEITSAIRIVADGGAVFGPSVAARMLLSLRADHPVKRAIPFPELTERERETLEELAAGRSNAAIASRLGISQKTVRNYVSSIFVKLHAPTAPT